MKDWICHDCEHEVLSDRKPQPIKWDDGHICHFEPKPMKEEYHVVTWDHKEQPDWDEINTVLELYDSPYITEIEDTGTDQYAIIVSDELISQKKAKELLRIMLNYWAKQGGTCD